MTSGFQDTELADDLVGVTSARLLAAGLPRGERLRAMRLLGVLANVADARRRVRRPLAELAVEFDLPVDEVDRGLDHLLGVGAARWEDGTLVLAALEPPAAGGLRLHDFLALAAAGDGVAPARRPLVRLRPASAVLAAAAVILLALVAPGIVGDRSATPVSSTRDDTSEVATTVAPAPSPLPGTATTATGPAAPTVPDVEHRGPVVGPTTTTVPLPCPAGLPAITVLGTTTDAEGRLAVDGQARNPTGEDVVIHGFTLRTTVAGREVEAPGTVADLVVPARSTVRWQATLPVSGPAGTLVQAALGDWVWSSPDIPSTCPSP